MATLTSRLTALDAAAAPPERARAGDAARPDAAGAPALPKPTGAQVFAYFVMILGMFMAILDIQIVSASIDQIQAGLSAAPDEVSWVQSSYLIAEVLMIPLTGFLQRALSLRYLFTLSALGFTLASMLCATATSIEQMIAFRALQGFLGGAMIPTVYSATFSLFGKQRQVTMTVLVGMVVTLAPTIGPTLGGWISTNFSWHWLFLVNVIPGLLIATVVYLFIDLDRPNFSLLRKVDLLGILFMGMFLGALQFVLEEGSKKQWFEDGEIWLFTGVAVAGAIGFFWRAVTAELPAVNLRPFLDRNFATGTILGFVLGMSLYGIVFIYPLFLGRIGKLNAEQIGWIMSVSGLTMMLTAPVAGNLARRLDLRLLVCIGFSLIAASAYMTHAITFEWRFDQFLWPQILRGIGLMLCIVSVSNVSFATLTPEQIKDASGLFTLVRNTGGAFGLAMISTVLSERTALHWSRLGEALNPGRPEVQAFIANLGARMEAMRPGDAELLATRQLAGLLQREAMVQAYADAFLLLAIAITGAALLPLFLRKPANLAGPPAGDSH